ncbi:sensor histidine kinase [Archangium sp.]|uniref:sensor histidine kinase n=1 Tax=Archangium sp. TaxID=1872627 RepID=UPI002D6A4129|nr:ATP-binding protein [Archangium sp.]HYO59043.1 ATP-binding protein [Archangium sp.]
MSKSHHPGHEAIETLPSMRGETTPEELLQLITRLMTNEPHARCRVGTGPLAPVAAALNDLAERLDTRRVSVDASPFGLRALVEQSPNIMFTCDSEQKVRFINYTSPGLTPEDVIGSDLYNFVRPEDHELVSANVQHVLSTGETAGHETLSAVKDYPVKWWAARIGPVKDAGQVVGFTMILTDVTALKETQLRLEDSLRKLEQSNRELQSFASVASHDLQEPLRKIQSFGERLASSSAALGPDGRDYLERMLKAASRMSRLINDLLAFARVGSRAQPSSRVSMDSIAHDVLSDLETSIEQAGATVTLGELPSLEADPTQMRQLLQNLLSNALKFRREGVAPAITLRGSVDAKAHRCELEVEDNGIGFEEKYRDRIFDVFQRLHGHGRYEGTGIGLAICRKIVERHGGSITARSTPGQGSTFIISLPLVQPSVTP